MRRALVWLAVGGGLWLCGACAATPIDLPGADSGSQARVDAGAGADASAPAADLGARNRRTMPVSAAVSAAAAVLAARI